MAGLIEKRLRIRGRILNIYLAGADGPGSDLPLVLLLASPLVCAGIYRPTVLAFAGVARVAVVNLPGSGKSSQVTDPPGTAELADYIPELTAALGARSSVLIGHSNAGPIALLAAVRHPQCVAALVLADSAGAHPSAWLGPVLAGRAIDAGIELRLTLLGWPALAWNLIRHTRNFISQVRRGPGDGLLRIAPAVQVPTLLAWGRRDHTMPLVAGERLHAAIPQARMVICETGSHNWLIQEPHRFAQAVIAEFIWREEAA